MKLIELNEGTRKELFEGTLKETVTYLKDNPGLYKWQLDEDPEAEMPDLDNIKTLKDLRYELEKIDLSWWALEVEDNTKSERLYIRIEPELKKKLQEQAEKEHRTLSNYIESVLIKEIEKEK